ncbi:MAG TPA: GTPase [Planctomycetota bacterium]|nr:GTPase [Planctomycetota bacterium]
MASVATTPIFVRVTGGGAGGISKLVLDGEDIALLLKPILKSKRDLTAAVSGDLLFGRLLDQGASVVDEVVIAFIGKKESATGNEQIELSCHGGAGALAAVEEALIAAGFQAGGPTGLIERAHLRGKLSLISIEAQLRLPHCVTSRQAEWLLNSRALQSAWERHGFNLAVAMQAGEVLWQSPLYEAVETNLRLAHLGRKLLMQHHVVILGPVNAGKSTLANALARTERHIISDIPGTTLDRLDTPLEIRGLNILLSDTAGLRDAADPIEREGQERALKAAQAAALRLVVLDGSRPPSEEDVQTVTRAAETGPTLLVLNKSDAGVDDHALGLGFFAGSEPLSISARSGAGLQELAAAVEKILLPKLDATSGPFTTRQENLLLQMKHTLQKGLPATEMIGLIRKFVGTRPDSEQLAGVLAEKIR